MSNNYERPLDPLRKYFEEEYFYRRNHELLEKLKQKLSKVSDKKKSSKRR